MTHLIESYATYKFKIDPNHGSFNSRGDLADRLNIARVFISARVIVNRNGTVDKILSREGEKWMLLFYFIQTVENAFIGRDI